MIINFLTHGEDHGDAMACWKPLRGGCCDEKLNTRKRRSLILLNEIPQKVEGALKLLSTLWS